MTRTATATEIAALTDRINALVDTYEEGWYLIIGQKVEEAAYAEDDDERERLERLAYEARTDRDTYLDCLAEAKADAAAGNIAGCLQSLGSARQIAAEYGDDTPDRAVIALAEAIRDGEVNVYAVVDADGEVVSVHLDERDGGDIHLIRHMERIAVGARWVAVDGPCNEGDLLDIDEDGRATVAA